MESDDMRNIWQSQGGPAAPLSLEELRKKGAKFRSRIVWRNVREYVGAAFVVGWFGYCAWAADTGWRRLGSALVVAGAFYLAFELHRRASASAAPGELAWRSCADFHRAQLVRQRDALSSVWKWYLGPLVPGLAILMGSGCVTAFRHSITAGLLSLIPLGAVALMLWFVGRLNRNAAAGIQRQIDKLETIAGE